MHVSIDVCDRADQRKYWQTFFFFKGQLRSKLSAEACQNNWLPKALISVQLYSNYTELYPGTMACCYSNFDPQYKKERLVSPKYKVFHPETG